MGAHDNIVHEAKRIEEDALYSAKGHFSAASAWRNFHWIVGVPTAVMAAIAGAFALSEFGSRDEVAGSLAVAVAALTAVTTFLNPNERAGVHHRAGTKYNSLRNRVRIFHQVDCEGSQPDEEIANVLKALAGERDELNDQSPQIPGWAYRWAKKGIEAGQAEYRVDVGRN